MATVEPNKSKQPCLVAGAGELISHVHRDEEGPAMSQYHFNLFRIDSKGEATNWLRPTDLPDIVKACQVLAFSIADDGWIEKSLHAELIELAGQLQTISNSWSTDDA